METSEEPQREPGPGGLSFGLVKAGFLDVLADRCWGHFTVYRSVVGHMKQLLSELGTADTRTQLDGELALVKVLEKLYASRRTNVAVDARGRLTLDEPRSLKAVVLEAPLKKAFARELHEGLDELRSKLLPEAELSVQSNWEADWTADCSELNEYLREELGKLSTIQVDKPLDAHVKDLIAQAGSCLSHPEELDTVRLALVEGTSGCA